jgi:hypothetical protein
MKQNFTMTFIISIDFADVRVAAALWQYLDNTEVSPVTYGAVENPKTPFNANAFKTAAKLFENEGMLFIRCKKGKLVCMIARQPKHFSYWSFYLDQDEMSVASTEEWLQWFYGLARLFPPVFGFGCGSIEYQAKHRTVRKLPNNKEVRGSIGNAYRDFLKYLPGIYWVNFFGAELVKHFGEETLMNLQETSGVRIADNLIAVKLTAPCFTDDIGERLSVEARISERIGSEFFFDRTRLDTKFRLVPGLQSLLELDQV